MVMYEDVLRDFQKHKVKYVLVGGLAVGLHGFARNTADMDIIVEMTDSNLAKVVNILKKRGYRVKQPVDPMGLAEKKTRIGWIRNKHLKAFNFYKDRELKEIDIIIDTPVSFEEAKRKKTILRKEGLAIPLMSIDQLIKMKSRVGRDIDKLDVRELKKISAMRGLK